MTDISKAERANLRIRDENDRIVSSRDSAIGIALRNSIESSSIYYGRIPNGRTPTRFNDTSISVVDTDTVTAIRECGEEIPVALNFASAKNPGGGYVKGRTAQEECLCRASTLYYVLKTQQGFYDHHRDMNDNMYSDIMIYSPKITFFRDRFYNMVEPFMADIITAAAPNNSNMNLNQKDVYYVMRSRISRVLDLTVRYGKKTLILGAWGCGVFKNDPSMVAKAFKESIDERKRPIDRITFAIPGGDNLREFKSVFG